MRFWRKTGGLGGETSGERDWRAITPEADAPRLPRMFVAETRITCCFPFILFMYYSFRAITCIDVIAALIIRRIDNIQRYANLS